MTTLSRIGQAVARIEERERARDELFCERFDRIDEVLSRIEAREQVLDERIEDLEKGRAYARAWLAGAIAAGTAFAGAAGWLVAKLLHT